MSIQLSSFNSTLSMMISTGPGISANFVFYSIRYANATLRPYTLFYYRFCGANAYCSSGACQCRSGHISNGTACIVDECKRGYCRNGGICSLLSNSVFVCACQTNYNGTRCQNNLNTCARNNCDNNAT